MVFSKNCKIISIFTLLSALALTNPAKAARDADILNAHEHAILFQKGVDAFMIGRYDVCDDYWLPIARAGDSNAAYNMGILFLKGYGVRRDPEEAVLWFEKAAANGLPEAQSLLGLIYIRGEHAERDIKKAAAYLKKAAAQQDHAAQYNLGVLYEHGAGVPKDPKKARHYYKRAAENGNEKALAKVSGLTDAENGAGKTVVKAENKDFNTEKNSARPVPRNRDEKIDIYEKRRAEKPTDEIHFKKELQNTGRVDMFKKNENKYDKVKRPGPETLNPFDVDAPQNQILSMSKPKDIFSRKTDISKEALQAYAGGDYRRARELWEKAFTDKNAEAGYNLGKMYEQGTGVKKNRLKAYRYYKSAAFAGNSRAKIALEEMRSRLSDPELMRYERATADIMPAE